MKTRLLTLLLMLVAPVISESQNQFQTGHTHDILRVKFSPDSSKLVSYSWGDSWLCYWDVKSGQLLWKSKTTFIQKADERYNLEDFGWNEDLTLLYSRSENGTFQTWDATTGRILSDTETSPRADAFGKTQQRISITKDYTNYYLQDSTTGRKITIKRLFTLGPAYDISSDGKLFAEGGTWGNAIIRITEIDDPTHSHELKGGRVPPYLPTQLENTLLGARNQRQAKLNEAKAQRDTQAAIETENFRKRVYISFEHYGDMTDSGELRMLESDEPNKSRVKKSAEASSAVWLRLHNDSPLPIKIPTQSMYLPNPKCFFEFSNGKRALGLCDNREIAVWFGLEDQKGKLIPYGFDFGSATILLPKTSALFAVPREILRNGNAIRFGFTFQKDDGEDKVSDYGTKRILRFRESELP